MKDDHVDVGRTIKCAECGSDDEMMWVGRESMQNVARMTK